MLNANEITALVSLNSLCIDAEKSGIALKGQARDVMIKALVPSDMADVPAQLTEFEKNWDVLAKGFKAAKVKQSKTFRSQGSQIRRALEAGVNLYNADGSIRTRKEVQDDIKLAEGTSDENTVATLDSANPIEARLMMFALWARTANEADVLILDGALAKVYAKHCKVAAPTA